MQKQSNQRQIVAPQSAELVDLIFENIKDYVIFTTDAEGHITSWNSSVERLLGYTEDEILGQSIELIFTPQDVAKNVHQHELQIARTQGRAENKRWHQRKNGSGFWANNLVLPLKSEDNTVRGFVRIVRDQTEQKQAEEQLEQSNRRIENILESVAGGFHALDREWRFVYVNRNSEKLTGRSREQLLGKKLWDEFPKTANSNFEANYRRALREQTAVTFEEFYEPLGTWFELRAYPSPDGLSIYFHNINERRKAEAELQSSWQFNQAVIDSLPTHIAVVDNRGTIVAVNRAWRDFDRENSAHQTITSVGVGANYFSVCAAGDETGNTADGKAISAGLAKVLRRETNFFSYEYLCRSATKPCWFLLTIAPLARSGDGAVVSRLNITNRRLAEIGQRKSETRYRTLFNSIDVGFCTIEIIFDSGDRPLDYRFVEANPAFVKQTGLENVVGKRMRELAPNHESFWLETYSKVALTGEPARFEHRAAALDRWYEVYAFRVEELASRKVAVLFNDITARKQAEQEREQLLTSEQAARAEAEEASRLKDEFLAIVSHELRTPLNAILGWAQMVKRNVQDHAQVAHAFEVIERNARAQNELIADLLDVSRIITGKLRLNLQAVDLATVILAAVDAARPAAEAKNVFLETLLDSNVERISGDPDRLQQVVWNLLSNAVKFTPKNGRVQVSSKQCGNSAIEIVVSDTGIGITPEFLPHVFDRFRQADQSATRKHGGLGLGLAIAQQLIELHGGQIAVESAGEGKGATFTVNLPLAPVKVKRDD